MIWVALALYSAGVLMTLLLVVDNGHEPFEPRPFITIVLWPVVILASCIVALMPIPFEEAVKRLLARLP